MAMPVETARRGNHGPQRQAVIVSCSVDPGCTSAIACASKRDSAAKQNGDSTRASSHARAIALEAQSQGSAEAHPS